MPIGKSLLNNSSIKTFFALEEENIKSILVWKEDSVMSEALQQLMEPELNEKWKQGVEAGIEQGDSIIQINEETVNTTNELISCVSKCGGNNIKIKYIKNGDILETTITPIKTSKNTYKIGLWVRDAAAGVGTAIIYILQSFIPSSSQVQMKPPLSASCNSSSSTSPVVSCPLFISTTRRLLRSKPTTLYLVENNLANGRPTYPNPITAILSIGTYYFIYGFSNNIYFLLGQIGMNRKR